MGLFDKLKEVFGKKEEKLPEPKKVPKAPKAKDPVKELTEKEKATKAGEPYVNIVSIEIDPNNVNAGAFELDWNELFIAKLVKAGYMKKKEDTDQDIIDRWWTQICRQVVLELYDQQVADPSNREATDMRTIAQRDIGNGRTEVS